MYRTLITVLIKDKPRVVRVQQNATSGIFSINVPREIIHEVEWEKGDSIFFRVQDKNKVIVEKVSGG